MSIYIEKRFPKMFSTEQKEEIKCTVSTAGIFVQGQLRMVDRKPQFTGFQFDNLISGALITSELPEWFKVGNTVSINKRLGHTQIVIELLRIMPSYTLTNEAGTVTIQTPDGKTLATIPADQAKTFADVEAAIWEQNKGKGNGEECVEATNYFLINGIKAK